MKIKITLDTDSLSIMAVLERLAKIFADGQTYSENESAKENLCEWGSVVGSIEVNLDQLARPQFTCRYCGGHEFKTADLRKQCNDTKCKGRYYPSGVKCGL